MRRAFLDRQQAQQGHLLCLFLIEGSTCLSLWERCLSEAKTERVNCNCKGPLSRLRRQLSQRESQVGALLPLPLGEVAERSKIGEGQL